MDSAESSPTRLTRNASLLFAARVTSALTTLAVLSLVSRLRGPDDLGLVALGFAAGGILAVLSDLGLGLLLVREASRVVGLYHDGLQVGFCRAVTDRVSFAYLADVYVLAEHRGRGLGEGLVREMVEASGWSVRWLLHTGDGHGLYQKFGFTEPSPRVMERSA